MIDFHNTFTPVFNWSNVRLIIMMAEIAGWESIQIDYVLDFSQTNFFSDVYLHLTANWFDMSGTGYIIKFANCPIVWVSKCKQKKL